MKGKFITKSILAGILIGIAGSIYLQCENKIVGSVLFSIGLIGVILLEANLFTGKIGYVDSFTKLKQVLVMLVLNLVFAGFIGLLYKVSIGYSTAFLSRLQKSWFRLLYDGFICGVCIYLAVECYKKSKNIITIIIPVVAFILSGAEHCIADIFYFAAGEFTWQGVLDILIIIVGNSIGSLLINRLQSCFEK